MRVWYGDIHIDMQLIHFPSFFASTVQYSTVQ